MNAFIIDDEDISRSTLTYMLTNYCPEISIVGESGNYEEALINLHTRDDIDILFLDVDLGSGKTGFELLNNLRDFKGAIIFISAYSGFAVDAFKYDAVHYLLKPIDPLELVKSIKRVKDQKSKGIAQKAQLLNATKVSQIALPCKNGIKMINCDDIYYLEAEGSYCNVVVQNNEFITVAKNMKYVLNILEPFSEFIKIHKSYAVNRKHMVSYIRKDGGQIILSNDLALPVSLTYKTSVRNIFKKMS